MHLAVVTDTVVADVGVAVMGVLVAAVVHTAVVDTAIVQAHILPANRVTANSKDLMIHTASHSRRIHIRDMQHHMLPKHSSMGRALMDKVVLMGNSNNSSMVHLSPVLSNSTVRINIRHTMLKRRTSNHTPSHMLQRLMLPKVKFKAKLKVKPHTRLDTDMWIPIRQHVEMNTIP